MEEKIVLALGALAQIARLRIMRCLVGAAEHGQTPTELGHTLHLPPATLSFHLKELVHAGLITQTREGRSLRYRPATHELQTLMGNLQQLLGLPLSLSYPGHASPAEFWHPFPEKSPMVTRNVLFLCTGNSARSILAEGLLNTLGGERFRAFSAGSHPRGVVNPMALEVLSQLGASTAGYRSKSWDEFAAAGAPEMDFVFTVCDQAAGEVCPVWPGQPITAHWGVADPSLVVGSEPERRRAYLDTAYTLRRRIELLLALPIDKLDRLALKQQVQQIGQQ